MNKEKLKKIKLLYYPYKAVKRIITGIIYYVQYTVSLFFISKNKKRVDKKIDNNEVLNVVFVVQYIPGWNKLEPIYSKMQKDQRFNPIIVCVPLNIQNHILMDDNGNDTYQYFIEHGYKAIDALLDDGSWFDLKKLEPDYVFHSRPYNAFMPKCYTSGIIVRYALICNVIYGMCLALNDQKVCINKDYFKDVFAYFSSGLPESALYRNIFKLGSMLHIQRCYPYGATGLEEIARSRKEKSKSSFQKTVIWTPRWSTDPNVGGSNFFNYRETIAELVEKNKDVLFIFRPHPLMFSNFIKTGEMTEDEAKEFKRYCNNTNNIILDESKSYSETFWNSDFLITDFSGIVPEYFVTGKPIIFCHSKVHFQFTETAKKMIDSCYEVNTKTDLVLYFNELVKSNDYKLQHRVACMNEIFPNVNNSSMNITKSLLF